MAYGTSSLDARSQSLFFKIQTHRVNTIALAGLCWTVVEYVPEMALAPRAAYLGAHYAIRGVTLGLNRPGKRSVK